MRQRSIAHTVMILFTLGLGLLMGCNDEPPSSVAESEVGLPETADPGLLLSIMVGMAANMDGISRGLWLEDLSAVAAAATAIAGHPQVSSTERARIQGALGTDFAAFVQGDRRVHDTAVRLAAAAAASDLMTTLGELAELQAGCVDCHQNFRQRLR